MILPLTSPILSDHQDLGPLSDLLRLPQNFGPIRPSALGEVHSHMGTLRPVALVVLVPYARLERIRECTPMDKRALPFFGLVKLSHSGDLGPMPVPYLL